MTTLSEAKGTSFLHPDGNGVRILALDGGDTRCFSQLLMLGELMRRLEYDYGRAIRPCEFFHSITGVGASGLIAILFGILGMTAEEATKAFSSICRNIFAEDVCNETCRSEILATAIEGLLAELNIPLDTRLEANLDRSAGCLLSVCYSSAPIHGCRMFRNYPSRHFSHDPTIVECARASWATPGLFSSIHVGCYPSHEELVSAVNGFNNATLEAVREVREIFGVDKAVSSFLSLGSGKRLPVSIHSDGFVESRVLDTDDTEETCERDFGPSGVYYRFSPEYTIQNEGLGVQNQLSSITSYTSVYLERAKTGRALESYLKASAYTSESDLQLRSQAQNVATHSNPVLPTCRLSPDERSILSELRIAGGHRISPTERCMEGTREDVLKSINDWTTDFNAPNILWLKGHPGVGKSAIAAEVVEQLGTIRRLGSNFFFQRQNAAVLTPRTLWCTVAYDLARRHPAARRIVVAKLEEEVVSIATANIRMLFRHFIHEPLIESTDVPNARSPVIVIDALDECGGLGGQNSAHRRHLIETLRNWSRLPGKFKLIVTSRGENDIERLFSEISHYSIEISAGQAVDARSSSDIRIFFTEQFRQIAERYPRSLSPSWPDHQIVNLLTDKAGGLFIWAKTVLKLIEGGEPQQLLRRILKGGETDGTITGETTSVHELYKQILSTVYQRPSGKDITDFRSIVGTIIFSKAPLSFSSLARLLSADKSTVEHICTALQSVLDSTGMLQFHHQSFVDFLINKDKCPQEYLIDPQDQHRSLTLACLRTMRENLRFNICSIESSYFRNDDIPDLATRAEEHIPAHLLYSCCWWASHLSESELDVAILEHLWHFMRKQFLSWLEVLSITRQVNLASQMLSLLIRWIPLYGEGDAMAMAIDMQKFVATFASVISQSVTHIYLSCLPFSPFTSTLWKQYAPIYPQTLAVQTGGLSAWPAVQNLLVGHGDSVQSVAFSPDGRRVVSGSSDSTIRIWDAETGQTITGPLQGHTDSVYSVAFSPDGRRVVSGSSDSTIRIWDAEMGQTIAGPLQGHSGSVYSLAFSPDGRHVAAGSQDHTIHIWDVGTGQKVMGPLQGHNGSIYCVGFSPDGRRVVSGSVDCTIQIWDAGIGQTVTGPLQGHKMMVNAVAFSPDGRFVTSGSVDSTVRIWDAETGQTVMGPLLGYKGWATSVALSLDGRCVASASLDCAIRVWDAGTGETIAGPLQGHSGSVYSLAFSPDGSRVVSGSRDQTIRIWDVGRAQAIIGQLNGHDSWVNSVAFSPDGRRVFSGSGDNTIRIWDAETAQMVVGPLKGHSNSVNSVALSPDGQHIVSGSTDGTIRIWDAVTGQTVTGPLEGHSSLVNSVAFSPDGRRVASGSYDCTIRIWDTEAGQMVIDPLEGHSSVVRSLAFSPDGRCVASGSHDCTIRIWDAGTGQMITGPLKGHRGPVNSVAFSLDGTHIVSGSSDDTIRIWDADIGQTVRGPLQGHRNWVQSVTFSPDGRHIVSGSDDSTLRVWDIETGQTIIGPLFGHSGLVNSVAFSPDGRCVVSGSSDHTIRIWDVMPGQITTGPLQGHDDCVDSVSFLSNERGIASSSDDNTIQSWEAEVGRMVVHPVEGQSGHIRPVKCLPDCRCVVSSSEAFNTGGPDARIHYPKNLEQSHPFFNDSSPMKDGWVLGPNAELLFWVPPSLRVGLLRPRNKLFIGEFAQTTLNLDFFVHGDLWTLCKMRDNSGNEGISDGGPFASFSGSSDNALSTDAFRSIPGSRSSHAKRKASQNLGELPGIVDIPGKKARLEGN